MTAVYWKLGAFRKLARFRKLTNFTELLKVKKYSRLWQILQNCLHFWYVNNKKFHYLMSVPP
mgnify:CR=1 FL=1